MSGTVLITRQNISMHKLRFVHAADLHLDAPFRGLSLQNDWLGPILRQSTFQALENLVQFCLQAKADFLLISGDVYNQEDRSLRSQLRFKAALSTLAEHGLSVYIVHGNHDPVGSTVQSLQWPENVHFFSSDQPQCLEFKRSGQSLALIHGASHTKSKETQNLARRFQSRSCSEQLLQIGLLHCNLGSNTGHEPYAPCELQDLIASGLDYWALGHVHSGGILSQNPYVVYPGNIQGLHINEQGPRGCYLVDKNPDNSLDIFFQSLEAVRWSSLQVNIQGHLSLDNLEDRILQKVQAMQEQNADQGLILRINLYGHGPLHSLLHKEDNQQEFLQHLRENSASKEPLLWIKDLHLQTTPEVDLDARREQEDFLGQVLQQAEEMLQDPDCKEHLQTKVLAELFRHRRARHYLQHLSQEQVRDLLHQARLLCADYLEPGDQ